MKLEYRFPQGILDFVRYLSLGDVKREVREDGFPVPMTTPSKALEFGILRSDRTY